MTFPIGYTQTLSIGSISLTLIDIDFDADQHGGLGYKRFKDVAHQMGAAESFYGATLLDGPFFPAKHQFTWSLILPPEKIYPLIAIWEEQQYRIKDKQADVAVRLLDGRLVAMERSPRTRAKFGTVANSPTPPPGFEFFWPQYDVILEVGSDLMEWYLQDANGAAENFTIKIAARELTLVPVTEDA